MSIKVQVDLRDRLGEARDQGPRPTCLAFAASDVHASVRKKQFEPLSAEFAFYHALKRKGGPFNPLAGVPLSAMLAAIEHDGQPLENGWPYLKAIPKKMTEYIPPKEPGDLYKRNSKEVKASIAAICNILDRGFTALVTFSPTENFHRAGASTILKNVPNDKVSGAAHAVVATGWGNETNGRAILVRNSWGRKWANEGHVWLAEDYLVPRLLNVVSME